MGEVLSMSLLCYNNVHVNLRSATSDIVLQHIYHHIGLCFAANPRSTVLPIRASCSSASLGQLRYAKQDSLGGGGYASKCAFSLIRLQFKLTSSFNRSYYEEGCLEGEVNYRIQLQNLNGIKEHTILICIFSCQDLTFLDP
jgi:hypothetical protein